MHSFLLKSAKNYQSLLTRYSYLYKRFSVDVALFTFIFLAILWLYTTVTLSLEFIILLISFVLAAFKIKRRHRELFLQCKIRQTEQLNNTVIELASLLFAIYLAGILGEFISANMSMYSNRDLTRIVFGVGTGLTVGIAIGLFFKRVSSHFVKS